MPYRDQRAVLVERLTELDAERRAIAERLAVLAPPPAPSRRHWMETLHGKVGAALVLVLYSSLLTLQLVHFAVRMPSGDLFQLYAGGFDGDNTVIDVRR